ncbi:hypothetical protein EDB81DRAFT_689924 [Dactylonectria macrodidyma]|uniref:Uncharacterized protein n=1 Tax=Dactylonectria macrodidyma TaxID=307937 RepID=A0A9P9J496_9HYPO|nr:hypothetical protein EDB81DRAFT_689924 [Dactylonectria macrodidyma]
MPMMPVMMVHSEDFWLTSRGIDLDSEDDLRIGSGRNATPEGDISLEGDIASRISSLLPLIGTLVMVAIYCTICLVLFLILRPRCQRVYAPRTLSGLGSSRVPSPPLPNGILNWVKPFNKISDAFIINHCSLDAFLFLRYLKVLRIVFIVGCCIAWPVLLPLHITGGGGLRGIDLLTIGNIKDTRRLYAHMAVAILWFSFILLTIVRECIYYVDLRQSYVSSPHYAQHLSSRTILLTDVPEQYQTESCLRRLFGSSVKHIWVLRTTKSLVALVREREKVAIKLEKAEIELIVKSNKARRKQLRASPSISSPTVLAASSRNNTAEGNYLERSTTFTPGIQGPAAVQRVPARARPHHRLWGQLGRSVDTINWARSRLKHVNTEIFKSRSQIRQTRTSILPAAFVEFDTQQNAHIAHQRLVHHRPMQMGRHLGIRPNEILWQSLRMSWRERLLRRSFVYGLIVAAIILWSFPTAIISVASNLELMSRELTFLRWIDHLPKNLLQLLQGFVPALALTLWIAVVPGMLRFSAVQAGVLSLTMAELFTQKSYFAFLVVQVFLVPSLTTAASSTLPSIIQDPFSAADLLAKNLPASADFFFSFILIQCLADGASNAFPIFELGRHHLLAKINRTPRMRYQAWRRMRRVHWGTVFPRITNMGVIAICYAGIAPLILIFAVCGMCFLQMVYRYNLIYVVDCDLNGTGLFYPRALLHLTTGLYLATACLAGIFFLKSAFAPMAIMVSFFILLGSVHLVLNQAITPLLHNLPQNLWSEKKDRADGQGEDTCENLSREGRDLSDAVTEEEEEAEIDDPIEADHASNQTMRSTMPSCLSRLRIGGTLEDQKETQESSLPYCVRRFGSWDWAKHREVLSDFTMRWLCPHSNKDHLPLGEVISSEGNHADEYPTEGTRRSYLPPELWLSKPTLWIPKDQAGVSQQEVVQTKAYAPISDIGATLDEKGRIVTNFGEAPIDEAMQCQSRWEAIESAAPSFLTPAAFGLS